MLAKQKKISRKEIKQDTMVTLYYKFVSFFTENKKVLSISAGVIVVVVIGFLIYNNARSSANDAANYALSKVMRVYNAGAYQQAIKGDPASKTMGLEQIVKEYGSSETGEQAKVFLANSYYFLKKYDLAMKSYDDYSGGSDYLKAAALAGQAACYEAQNNAEKAGDLYMKAAKVSSENVLTPEYMLYAGINYMNIGKNDEAREIFLSIKKDYAKSAYTREVERYLAQVE
jgi:tetratricopeptide (TPR) repeat protein